MTLHLWLELKGRVLWAVVVFAVLGLSSLCLEVARLLNVAVAWTGCSGWTEFALALLVMLVLFSGIGLHGFGVLSRSLSSSGPWRTRPTVSLDLARGAILFLGSLSLACVFSLLAQVLRLTYETALWLGVDWPEGLWWRIVGGLCVSTCLVGPAYLGLHRLAERAAAGAQIRPRPQTSHGS